MMSHLKTYLEYLALQLILAIIQVLPISMCASLCRGIAWLFCDVFGFRRKVIDENIAAVYPDLSPEQRTNMSREMWYHLTLMACEVAQAPLSLIHI